MKHDDRMVKKSNQSGFLNVILPSDEALHSLGLLESRNIHKDIRFR